MAFLYVNHFSKYVKLANPTEVLPSLDTLTVALAALSLASKSTEAPRRLREFLLPAWRIINSHKPSEEPLLIPSNLYDTLRSTLVQAELILLRVMKFELRKELPFEFASRYLARSMDQINARSDGWLETDDYDGYSGKQKAEYNIVDLMETSIGRICKLKVLEACRNYQVASYFPTRVIAAVSVHLALQEQGLAYTEMARWLKSTTSSKVDIEDFREALGYLS
ncbi:hypothetical protein GQ43DRAFT_417868 [Delitschia confertaspora ATCC 74209]|uniref:Cyclin N-terminal domain-containing protein n=1 Tax=Delitschia confertaspora ATCC 74209 TaxID=1513339 RepID=A0A9P4JNS7_9PLEO|nr:hypothetical protein GQ43DRAFT_417868 [Delitschia confertaspora ATCC 74209]